MKNKFIFFIFLIFFIFILGFGVDAIFTHDGVEYPDFPNIYLENFDSFIVYKSFNSSGLWLFAYNSSEGKVVYKEPSRSDYCGDLMFITFNENARYSSDVYFVSNGGWIPSGYSGGDVDYISKKYGTKTVVKEGELYAYNDENFYKTLRGCMSVKVSSNFNISDFIFYSSDDILDITGDVIVEGSDKISLNLSVTPFEKTSNVPVLITSDWYLLERWNTSLNVYSENEMYDVFLHIPQVESPIRC